MNESLWCFVVCPNGRILQKFVDSLNVFMKNQTWNQYINSDSINFQIFHILFERFVLILLKYQVFAQKDSILFETFT